MTNIEIGLSAAVFIALINQLAFQPKWTARLIDKMVADLREHVKECDQKLAALSAMLMAINQEPAE